MNWLAFFVELKIAEEQFIVNAPLDPEPASEGGSIADTLTAIQPWAAKANAFVTTRPGAVRAARTMLTFCKGQGWAWAGELDDLLASLPGTIATVNRDLPMAIGVLKWTEPAATGITGEDPNDHNIKDH